MQAKQLVLVIISLFFSVSCLAQAKLEASVDKNTVASGEPFRYSIVAADYQGTETPDFSVLNKDFTIANQGQSSQISIVNNKTTRYTQWVAVLLPKHDGTFTIPSIKLGNQVTKPITVKVLPASQAATQGTQQVFIENSAEPTEAYVQGQVIYSLKLYYSRSIRNPNLDFPSSDKYVTKQLEPNQQYSKIINGVAYQVLELRIALFPQKSGSINIPAPMLTGYIQKDGPKGAWMMNALWKGFKTQGKPITLKVKPAPSSAGQQWWLPAKSVTLDEKWSENPQKLQVGTPVTRTVTITADGVTAVQLPNLTLANSDDFQTYPDKPQTKEHITPTGITSRKTFRIAYIPSKAGKVTLPAITVNWWNTKADKAEIATIPSKTVNIKAGSTIAAPITTKPTIQPVNVKPSATSPTATPMTVSHSGQTWFWLANLFLVLWIATLFLLWFGKSRQKRLAKRQLSQHAKQHIDSIHKAKTHLKKVCLANDAKQAKVSLLNLAHAIWSDESLLNLGAVTDKLSDKTAIKQLKHLDKHLYTQSSEPWDGLSFWDAIKNELTKKADKQVKKQHPLPNLYLGDPDE